jgi:hypothetical protein
MRKNSLLKWAIPILLAMSPLGVFAQRPGLEIPVVTPGPGWKACPRCINAAHFAEDRKQANVDTRPFDPHDLSGVWGGGDEGVRSLDLKNRPPLTPDGEKLNQLLQAKVNPKGVDTMNSKDPVMVMCDPLGWPRSFGLNYGFEFVQTLNRVFEFFEWSHTWRTIWTDGRKLPDDPPVERFLGYSIGRWDGDTFVVESSGYDERALIGSAPIFPLFPHTSEMRVVEHYKRLDYGKLQASLTIIDPKVFANPWTTSGTLDLAPNVEIGEYFCVPSESTNFTERQTIPSNGGPEKRQ